MRRLAPLCALGLAACGGRKADLAPPEELVRVLPVSLAHGGPAVAPGGVDGADATARFGTARFVPDLYDRFDVERTLGLASFADGFYRAPASEGYERVVDRVIADLYAAGFGAEAGYALDVRKSGLPYPAWTPESAVVEIVRVDERGTPIQAIEAASFAGAAAPLRTMLPVHAPGCDVVGPLADGLDALTRPGLVLLTEQRIRDVESEARARGAVAVLSSFLPPFCVDPAGGERHIEAVFQDAVRPGTDLPSLYVSPKVARALRNAAKVGGQVRLQAAVRFASRPLRTVIATIEGAERPAEAVHVVAHVDGAGANDNAAGLAAMVEGALLVKRLVDARVIPRPKRSLSFVFGQEAAAGDVVFGAPAPGVVAAVVTDMLGASRSATGAVCLLERGFDPAALAPLPPDEHTAWGPGAVAPEDLFGQGLAIVLRQALLDTAAYVAARTPDAPPWETREHPFEGGSDHDRYLAEGVAACLLWHFTDFAFQTSLDRMAHVDGEELRRSAVAALAGALAIADALPTDLERHLDTLNIERQMRLDAVVRADAGPEALALWKGWFDDARHWLNAVCLGEPLPAPAPLRTADRQPVGAPAPPTTPHDGASPTPPSGS